MSIYLIQRLGQSLLTLLGLSVIVFALAHLSGDPVSLLAPPEASAEDMARLRAKLGLDKPLHTQYLIYITQAAQGDFGESIRWKTPAMGLILDRFPNTLLLATSAILFGICLAIPVGVVSAVKRGTLFDSVGKVVAIIGQSMPSFWIGILLIMAFALYFPIFPTSGIGTAAHLVLPSLTLGGYVAASMMRVTRSAMLDALDADYVRTARSKGVSEWRVIWKHAFRNAATPVLTIIALDFANILRGAVITETVFGWPGIGKLAVDAVYARDFPLVQAAVLFMGLVFLGVNLLVDLIYTRLDPRITHG